MLFHASSVSKAQLREKKKNESQMIHNYHCTLKNTIIIAMYLKLFIQRKKDPQNEMNPSQRKSFA